MQNLCSSCLPSKPRLSSSSAVSILSASSTVSESSVASNPRVIIVGAGIAGLACAVKLIDYGIKNITILEAEKRIGGRIHTIPFGENVVDLGAQWCHGEKDNAVFQMVGGLNVLETTGDIYVSFQCIRSNGEIVPVDVIEQLKELLGDIFMNKRAEISNFDGSFGEFLEIYFYESLKDPKYDELDMDIVREFFENFKKIESSESSIGLDEISARGFLEYWDCEGDYMLNWKNKGYHEFIRILLRVKPHSDNALGMLHSKINFNSRVNLVEWNRDDGLVRVYCDNTEEYYEADNVVMTVSLGVLKKFGASMFKPSLPENKQIAIDNLGFGSVFKIFVEFPHKFWPANWTGFTTLWRTEDLLYLQETNTEFLQEIYGFYLVNYQPKVLLAWAVGPAVLRLEKLSLSDLENHVMYILRRFLTEWTIPDPVYVIGTSWSSNNNFCGGYSFRTVETENANTSAAALATPLNTMLNVPMEENGEEMKDDNSQSSKVNNPDVRRSSRFAMKPTLMFAGEATSTHYFSTVHGAFETGIREAKRLAGFYEFEKQEKL